MSTVDKPGYKIYNLTKRLILKEHHDEDNVCKPLHISANVRLVIEPDATGETVMVCTEIEVEGVVDYHGSKEDWFIP